MTETPTPALPIRAEPLTNLTPALVSTIIDFCMEHRPWYSDYAWRDPNRRALTTGHLAKMIVDMHNGSGMVWGVWRDAEIRGIIQLEHIVPKTDALCHFIFFDRALADKKALCISLMRWCFDTLELHRLSVEIPTYARALAKFARKLGFRYEAENREPYQHKDERLEPLGLAKAYVGSRRFRAALYEDSWHDVCLLSLFREEFHELYGRSQNHTE